MTFSYSLLLIPYALFFAIFVVFAVINFYNLAKYGGLDIVGFWATFLFLAGIVIILFISYQNLIIFDWNQTITVFDRSDILPQRF